MKYAIKIPLEDEGWLFVTEFKKDGRRDIAIYDTFEKAQETNILVWSGKGKIIEFKEDPTDKLTDEEIEELRAKKEKIKEDLYNDIKMEMFKESSRLEGIEYEDSDSNR